MPSSLPQVVHPLLLATGSGFISPTPSPAPVEPTWGFSKLLSAIINNHVNKLSVHGTHLWATLIKPIQVEHKTWHVVQSYLPPWSLPNFQSTLTAHHVAVSVITSASASSVSPFIFAIFLLPICFFLMAIFLRRQSHPDQRGSFSSFSSSDSHNRQLAHQSSTNSGQLYVTRSAPPVETEATPEKMLTRRQRFRRHFGKRAVVETPMPAPTRITFADVGGIDEAKAELEEVVDFLKNPKRYEKLNAKLPRGVLLVGKPGTGKTLCAKAVAGEAGVNFISASGSQFVELFVGKGAQNIRATFAKARANAPCILFIDELDSVGRKRGSSAAGGEEYAHALNQLLTEMDGFDHCDDIVVIAATNRPEILDEALVRPGRFDRQVIVHAPDVTGREKILAIHSANTPLAEDVSLSEWAKQTTGFVGASLANLVNEAAIFAAKKGHDVVTREAFQAAFHKVLMGPVRNIFISPEDKERTAYHEAGHALMAVLTPNSDPLGAVSILPRGMALGVTISQQVADKHSMTLSEMEAKVLMALGGRVGEEIRYNGDISTGPSDDMNKASRIVKQMVYSFGMSEMGVINYEALDQSHLESGMIGRGVSEETIREIDLQVKRLMNEYLEETRHQLKAHKKALERLVKSLLEKETLNGQEIMAALKLPNNATKRHIVRLPNIAIPLPSTLAPLTPASRVVTLAEKERRRFWPFGKKRRNEEERAELTY